MKRLRSFWTHYFGPSLDFRLRLFNILAVTGVLLCIYTIVVSRWNSLLRVSFTLAAALLSIALMKIVTNARNTERYYIVTVICIFYAFFPTLFFTGGGVDGSLVIVLVLGVVFTTMLLRGRKALLFAAGLIVWYSGIFIVEIFRPQWFTHFGSETARLIDMAAGFAVISTALALCIFFLLQLYDRQQEALASQSELLIQANRAKNEFLSNASHEMRTPLTVVSVNIQSAMSILQEQQAHDPEAIKLLESAQNEVMRLARMVGGMLTLASMSETAQRENIDFSALLQGGANMLLLFFQKKGNTITTEIESHLNVFGSADLLAQVISNLLQNAGSHTQSGAISLTAQKHGSEITVTVYDTGSGIAPAMLPHVFERGVSDGGTGLGLYLCKAVVESHGGRIWIESEQGKGTTAAFTLPEYEGQFGGETQ